MAAEMRTVRVTGLPVHMSENRLSDKIHIHFLRKKNGGGEISSLTISKSTPGMAFITFEESEVALRLAKQGKHIFKVNDKSYNLVVSLHHEKVDPDEVILHMSMTVDHNKLPEGSRTLFSLHKTFPDVQLIFDPQKESCTLSGRYTEVQSLCNLVLMSVDSEKQNSGDGLLSKAEKCGFSLEKKVKSPLGENEDAGLTKNSQLTREFGIDMENTVCTTGLPQLGNNIPQVTPKASMDERWSLEPEDGTSFEDFSLVVDSDIYRYFHKHCTNEYQSILSRHKVEVLDMTCEDITTLYFKPKKSLSDREHRRAVKNAHEDLAYLYQREGSQLRKESISKSGIPKKDLETALESLKQRLPKMMIDEGEGNMYLVGSKSDVSEAKQFILEAKGIRTDKDILSDNLFPLSQTTCTFSHQVPLEPPEQSSDIFQPLKGKFQAQDHQFNTWKDHQKSKEICCSKEITCKSDDQTHVGSFSLPAESKTVMDEELFSSRRNCDTSTKRDFQIFSGGWYDKDRSTEPLFLPAKPLSAISTCDLDKRPLDNPGFISEETKLTTHTDTTLNGEKQHKSSMGYKTKRAERDMKMAANFSKEMPSVRESDYKSCDTIYAVDLKTDLFHKVEDIPINESKLPDSGQAHSLPFPSKSSVNSNLKPIAVLGNMGAKGSVRSKMDILKLKGDLKKPMQFSANSTERKASKMPAYSIESQSFSFGHMDLCGDINKYPIIPSGLTRKRSNSFSGNVSTGLDEQKAVDLNAGQKERSHGSQTKEVFTVDVCVPIKIWIYLKSVYSSEIDNLTSDLQTKENIHKDELTLCLKGADSEKVNECWRNLKSLIATTEMDFDSRTLQLSHLGVSDCKDKALVDFCSEAKHVHKKVKIVIMSKTVMILGPKSTCQQVEADMMEFFNTDVSGMKATVEGWKPHNPSPLEIPTDPPKNNSDSKSFLVADRPTPTGAHIIPKKDLPRIPDQSNDQVLKNVPKSLDDQARDTSLDVINKDKREQEYRFGIYKNSERDQETVEMTQCLDNTAMPTLWKNTDDFEGKSQLTGNFTDQENVGCSGDQKKDVAEQPGASSPHLPSYVKVPSSCVCGSQSSDIIQTACGMNLCSQCQKQAHASCKHCPSETNLDSWGIKGTMSVRESTITIPGFIRDTALKIVYEIPDGIQGEGHPCPGTPFKGSKFEAFLPLNGDTKRLVPLLKKAFQKGLTFTVKEGAGEAQVVWGCIPHKIRLEGGSSRNGYPDSSYIRRLAEALKKAGLEE